MMEEIIVGGWNDGACERMMMKKISVCGWNDGACKWMMMKIVRIREEWIYQDIDRYNYNVNARKHSEEG